MDYRNMQPSDVQVNDVLMDSVGDVAVVSYIDKNGDVDLQVIGREDTTWHWLAGHVILLARDKKPFVPLPDKDVDDAIESIKQAAARQASPPG